MELLIPQVQDFALTGAGDSPAWAGVDWQPLQRVGPGAATYATRAKVAYSPLGIYTLVDSVDQRLTCTMTQDGADIYREDVMELFLWPEESQTVYFEYEISPLGVELPILVANHNGQFHGWLPWHYEGERLIRRATAVRGGDKASGATVTGWSAECFIPFALLVGLANTPPTSGTRWRANIYRIDYDALPFSQWAWCPDVGGNFHNIRHFGTFVFA